MIDASRWTLCFANATPKTATSHGNQRSCYQPHDKPPMPICRNHNNKRCHSTACRYRHVCAKCESPRHVESEYNKEAGLAISIDPHSPPIPRKLANKIWHSEYVDLSDLLPARLGVPQPTLMGVLTPNHLKAPLNKITTIEEWVTGWF